ncbi:MAG: hypothetical protein ABSB74_19390 [Tepidisphaeraceae bacterium]
MAAVLAEITTLAGDGITGQNAHWLRAKMLAHGAALTPDSDEQMCRILFALARAGSIVIHSGKPDSIPSRVSFGLT